MEPEYFSPTEFIQYSENGECKFLKGCVVHDSPEEYAHVVKEADNRENFLPDPPVEKPERCCMPDCTEPTCKSFLCDSYCPAHYAQIARWLRIPDTEPPAAYLGQQLLGSEVVLRLSPEKKHSRKHLTLQQRLIVKFKKGKMYIYIDKIDQIVVKWRYYTDGGNAIFEIFDSIHYGKDILMGDYKARLEGQPMCENLLTGKTKCLSTLDYPVHDKLPELVASSRIEKTYGLPGVFPRRDNKSLLTRGKFCVRCAPRTYTKDEPPKEEVKEEVKPLPKDMTEQLIQSLQQQIELQKKLYEHQNELIRQQNSELSQMKKELSKAIAAASDAEDRLRKVGYK